MVWNDWIKNSQKIIFSRRICQKRNYLIQIIFELEILTSINSNSSWIEATLWTLITQAYAQVYDLNKLYLIYFFYPKLTHQRFGLIWLKLAKRVYYQWICQNNNIYSNLLNNIFIRSDSHEGFVWYCSCCCD